MRKLISARLAGTLLLILLGVLAVFHVLVLLKIVPSGIVWGGRAEDSAARLFALELISLLITFVFIFIAAVKTGRIKTVKLRRFVHAGTWIVCVYFFLNTIGNLASGVSAEKMIFTPLSILMCLLSFRVAIEK